jgi:moderate conductance mechanosensitive channel
MIESITELPPVPRALAILLVALLAHLFVRGLQRAAEFALEPGEKRAIIFARHPKLVTVISLTVSAVTFVVYFAAIGLILNEFGVPLTAYFASATIIGLAVGFGSQGLVQDVVAGLTLIFSDAMDVGDVVEIAGQVGRVERIGLRFTVLKNIFSQRVLVPNRNISQISRYRGGVVRAYVDAQVPEGADPTEIEAALIGIARSFQRQHAGVVGRAETAGVSTAGDDGWRFVRVVLRIWPGQQPLIENAFRQRVTAALRGRFPEYADWMVTVTYRVR